MFPDELNSQRQLRLQSNFNLRFSADLKPSTIENWRWKSARHRARAFLLLHLSCAIILWVKLIIVFLFSSAQLVRDLISTVEVSHNQFRLTLSIMQSSEMLLLPNQILARPTTETTTVKNVKQLEYYADWSWAGGRLERQREEKRVRCNSGWEQSIKKSWSEAVKRALLFCRLCKVLLLLISELAAVSIWQ